ncbi:hypothetical protein WA026_008781 [Henosepilachna vigintioctopunctata]|uniref:40S ribosomal protein SA n=1 Tax=Henosepilachna vigintioctopunctata TaxID=420089 RepID=A0AAW1VD42_9CUCU
MSGGLDVLSLREDDFTMMLAANTHLGTTNVDYQMEQYIHKRRADGVHIINFRKTWAKILLAARAIEHPSEIQAACREPRLLIVTDPALDQQPITEASYVNIPVIAICNTDSPLRFVDITIPANNKASYSIGLIWWLLPREALRLRGTIQLEVKWKVVVDLFFREPQKAEKEEQTANGALSPPPKVETQPLGAPDLWPTNDPQTWEETPTEAAPPAVAVAAPASFVPAGDDWASQVQDEWNANSTHEFCSAIKLGWCFFF